MCTTHFVRSAKKLIESNILRFVENTENAPTINRTLYWLRSHLYIMLGVIPFAYINRNSVDFNFLGIWFEITLLVSMSLAWFLIFATRYLSKSRSLKKELYLHSFTLIFFLSPVLISYAGLLGILFIPLIFTALFIIINFDHYKHLMANELLKIQLGIIAGYLISTGLAFFLYVMWNPTFDFDVIS